jgi:putative molybdopterin biosynthesis protein
MIKMSKEELNAQKFYTIEEVANLLKLSYLTVFRWIQAGKLSAYKVGKRYRIGISDLNNFLERSKKYGNTRI